MNPIVAAAGRDTIYQAPDFVQFFRRPDSLQGQRFFVRGRVTQAWEDEGEPTVIVAVEGASPPYDEVAVTLPQWEGPLPQGELVVYGICRGTHVELHSNRCGAVARPHLEVELLE